MNRRQFIKKIARAVVGARSGAPLLCPLFRPSQAHATSTGNLGDRSSLSMLTWSHFVPAADEKLREQAVKFAQAQEVLVRVDTVPYSQIPVKLAAEVHAQAGHDIVIMADSSPWLYREHLVDVDEVIEDLGEKQGGWYPFTQESAFVIDSWKAVPWYWQAFPGLYREDLFGQAGLPTPQSWEDVLNAGRILKQQGHPVGIAISQTNDAYYTFWSILWSFGGKVLEADGKTLALNSPETEAALRYYQNLFREAMDPEVLSWDDAGNNRFLLSGKGSWIQNPISPYLMAVGKKMAIADKIGIHPAPAGPAGKHVELPVVGLGIWKFSKNQQLAKAFIQYLLQPENYSAWIVAGNGNNLAPLRAYENHPIWAEHPKLKILPGEAPFGHALGWPSPPNPYIQRMNDLYILPNMAAKAVTGTPIQTAIAWAEEQIRKILGS